MHCECGPPAPYQDQLPETSRATNKTSFGNENPWIYTSSVRLLLPLFGLESPPSNSGMETIQSSVKSVSQCKYYNSSWLALTSSYCGNCLLLHFEISRQIGTIYSSFDSWKQPSHQQKANSSENSITKFLRKPPPSKKSHFLSSFYYFAIAALIVSCHFFYVATLVFPLPYFILQFLKR